MTLSIICQEKEAGNDVPLRRQWEVKTKKINLNKVFNHNGKANTIY